jgi:hypothetical protein
MGKTGKTQKKINGKPNPKYVDVLDEDKPIAGQEFVCVSFISPENILKQKNIFFFEQFLKKWEFQKSMEKFIQFLNFTSYKYNISFDDLSVDFKDFVEEEKLNISKGNMDDDYKTFLDRSEVELNKQFNAKHDFETNTRGIKIRGSYPTLEEAELHCKLLREMDPHHDIMVGPVGVWMPWEPEAYKTGKVEYLEEELNQLMHEKLKNEANAKMDFDKRLKDTKQKAIEENIKNAEKSGNVLTQTIDGEGNLIGINNTNTQENRLSLEDAVTSEDVARELFEGEDIITTKTDNGQSKLISGPFSNTGV